MKLSRKFGLLSLVLCALFLAGSAFASVFPSPERAPINPEFLKYQENQSVNDGMRRFTGEIIRQGGYVPSPLDMSHLRNADYSAFLNRAKGMRGEAFPRKYDLRTSNRVTAVRDQGGYGVCWAFAALGSVESQYLVQGGGVTDLSEMHLGWFAFKDGVSFKSNTPDPLQNGGNNFMSAALLARWTGPVSESDAPYSDRPTLPSSSYANQFHVQDVFVLGLTDDRVTKDVLKKLVTTYGGVSVAYYEKDAYFNSLTNAYHYAGTSDPNHQVLLVGWDDDFRKEFFAVQTAGTTIPRNNGAWLIKNSWGTGWGDNGYFWISYEDTGFRDGAVFIPEATSNYQYIYDYDPLGATMMVGYKNPTAWASNVFVADRDLDLKAVSFYTADANVSYEISVYRGVKQGDAISGTRVFTQSGSEVFAGYHTIKLNKSVFVAQGERYAVVIKLMNPSSSVYPLVLEAPVKNYSEQATSKIGQSFISPNGANWQDLAADNANNCIKVFASAGTDPGPGPGPGPGPDTNESGGCNSAAASGFLLVLPAILVIRRRFL